MKIEHIAIWAKNIDKMRLFYETYFQAVSSPKYNNVTNKFESYFLVFSDGARLELMSRPDVITTNSTSMDIGFTHVAFKLGSIEEVDFLTEKLRINGVSVVGEPRLTGDGYYESVILDPEGNRVELVA